MKSNRGIWLLLTLLAGAAIVGVYFAKPPIREMPMLGGPRSRARCASNLKQIGIGLAMYAENYHGQLPPENGAKGLNYIYPTFMTSAKIFHCGNDDLHRMPVDGQPF